MAYRWKDYNPMQNGGAPTVAGIPNAGQAAFDASQAAQMANGVPQGAPTAVEDFEDVRMQIREKQGRLAQVTARIEEIDRQYPELKNGGQEWEIAAKRAELGDMSAYDSMMARGQQAGNASAIEGELKNAEKLTWGLSAKSDEDRAMARNQIEVALRSAEEWQAKTGQKLPDSYYRLKAALDNSGAAESGLNAREYSNGLALKIYRGTATDEEVEKGIEWAEENPNSEEAKMILEAARAAKPKTVESRKKAAEEKKRINGMVSDIEGKTPTEQNAWWNSLSQKDRAAVLKIATWKSGPNGDYLERKK